MRFDLSPARKALLEKLRQGQGNHRASVVELRERARSGPVPLSFAQQRLWFLDQLVPGNPFYNINSVVPLKVPIDVKALRWSVNEIVRRHDALRTVFTTVDGTPMQVVRQQLEVDLPVIDLQSVSAAEREAQAMHLAAEEGRASFDLSGGPLIRTKLLRLAPDDHLFLLTVHHIVCDGWSTNIFSRELSDFYLQYLSGTPTNLPQLPMQYADFAVWQRQWLRGEVLERQLQYWRAQLDQLPIMQLPTDRPRPAELSYRGANVDVTLPRRASAGLKRLAQQESATPFMAALAVFKVLLHRYCGQADIVVGCPMAGRTRTEVEPLIGFFVNTLVLRTDLSGRPSFRALLRRVRETALSAFANQDLPFEMLVEELQPERDLSRNPLFQVMFQLVSPLQAAAQAGGEAAPAPQVSRGTALFDLALHLAESANGLWGLFEFSTDLFEASSVERMARHFGQLMESVVADPDRPIGDLPMLLPEERRQILFDWNDTAPRADSEGCVHRLVERQVARSPDAIALCAWGATLTYRQLDRAANRLARRLQELGVGPEVRVGLCVERSLELPVALYAVLKAGGAYVPLDSGYPRERLAFMLADADIRVLITQRSLLDALPPHAAQMVLLDSCSGDDPGDEASPASPVAPQNLAYVIYTSGSTGVPKGIAMPHAPLVNLLNWQIASPVFTSSATVLQFASPSFDVSFQEILSTWCSGGRLVVLSETQRRDPLALWGLIAEHELHRLFLPVAALQQLAEAAPLQTLDRCTLREIITAGEPLQITAPIRRLFAALPNCRLQNQYGPAETHVVSAHTLSTDPSEWPVLPPIGRPIAGCPMYILDAESNPVAIGAKGELHLGGAGVSRGYLGRPRLTAARFGPNPYDQLPGARLYRTGDSARYLANGDIEFLGRLDDQVKIRGYRIELGEIEATLARHPLVADCVVIARGQSAQKRLLAYVVAAAASHADRHDRAQEPPDAPRTSASQRALDSVADEQRLVQDLRRFLSERLPAFMLPSAVVCLAALPLTPNGKVDKMALPDPGSVGDGSRVAPRTELEAAIASVWANVLHVDGIGVHDHFFGELGGHSLLATQVVSQIRAALAMDLPLSLIFRAPTVAQLAELVEELAARPGTAASGF